MFEILKGNYKRPAKILLYGTEGIGKTTFACKIPDAIVFDLEKGTSGIDCSRIELANIDKFWEAIKWIAKEPEYKTIIIDSWTKVEKYLIDKLLKENNWDTLEKPGYGKGYEVLKHQVQKYLVALDFLVANGKNVVTIAHVRIKPFADPLAESYDRYEPDIQKASLSLFVSQMDAVLFYRWKTFVKETEKGNRNIAKSNGEREMFTQERAAFIAKNRYNFEPSYINPTQEILKDVII